MYYPTLLEWSHLEDYLLQEGKMWRVLFVFQWLIYFYWFLKLYQIVIAWTYNSLTLSFISTVDMITVLIIQEAQTTFYQ